MEMIFQFLLIIIFILSTAVGFTENSYMDSRGIRFDFVDTEEGRKCKKNVLTWIAKVNQKLPDGLIPDDFTLKFDGKTEEHTYSAIEIKFSNQTSGNIEVMENVVSIASSCSEPHFIHEYGHIVLGRFLMKNSLPWKYSVTWKIFNLSGPIIDFEMFVLVLENIDFFEELISEDALDDPVDKYLKRMLSPQVPPIKDHEHISPESIKEFTKLIKLIIRFGDRIIQAQQIDNESPFDLHEFNSHFYRSDIKLEDIMSPFHELFADALAVLVLEDWSAMKKAVISDFQENKYKTCSAQRYEGEEAILHYSSHRGFTREDFFPVDYSHGANEETNPYCQVTPTRFLIRDIMENNPNVSPGDMIEALGMTIIDIFENELVSDPEKAKNWSFTDKNGYLSNGLKKYLRDKYTDPV